MNLNLFPFFVDKLDDHHFKRQRIFYNEEYKQKAKDGYKILLNNQKRIVDYDTIESLEGYGYESKDIYTKSYFSIVTETEFQDKQDLYQKKQLNQ
jgi:hypothetical protein